MSCCKSTVSPKNKKEVSAIDLFSRKKVKKGLIQDLKGNLHEVTPGSLVNNDEIVLEELSDEGEIGLEEYEGPARLMEELNSRTKEPGKDKIHLKEKKSRPFTKMGEGLESEEEKSQGEKDISMLVHMSKRKLILKKTLQSFPDNWVQVPGWINLKESQRDAQERETGKETGENKMMRLGCKSVPSVGSERNIRAEASTKIKTPPTSSQYESPEKISTKKKRKSKGSKSKGKSSKKEKRPKSNQSIKKMPIPQPQILRFGDSGQKSSTLFLQGGISSQMESGFVTPKFPSIVNSRLEVSSSSLNGDQKH
jgi:hypothetical protein